MAHKKPFASDEQVVGAATAFPTPFYLYDEAGIRKRVQHLIDAFSWNPGFREYFAVKANPNPELISLLTECGCGLDCASATELLLAQAMGITGETLMFSSNETPDADYQLAHRLDAITNLDDIVQLEHYRRSCKGFPNTMSVRLNPGGTLELANGIQGEPEHSKFGMTISQAKAALKELHDANVSRLGVHAFLASNTQGNEYYPALARMLFTFVREVEHELGIKLAFVNLSGGIGVDYHPDDEPCNLDYIASEVRRVYEEIIGDPSQGELAIYTELGRFMMGPFGALITRVISTKSTYRNYLGCDACSADLIRPMMYNAYHHITVIGKQDMSHDHIYDVVGGLCENSDRLARERPLPACEEGDLLFIHDAGAHCRATGFNYNGKLRTAEILLTSEGTYRLIRRAETPADYFATLDCLEIGDKLKEATSWI